MKNSKVNLTLQPKRSESDDWLVFYGLDRQEWALISMIAAGWSKRKMSASLQISYAAIQDRMQRIYAKLGVRNRSLAKVKILREGLLPKPAHCHCPTCGALRNQRSRNDFALC